MSRAKACPPCSEKSRLRSPIRLWTIGPLRTASAFYAAESSARPYRTCRLAQDAAFGPGDSMSMPLTFPEAHRFYRQPNPEEKQHQSLGRALALKRLRIIRSARPEASHDRAYSL